MHSPQGSVEGLCSASSTIFAVGMAFLGYWGFLEPTPWRPTDVAVAVAALAGFAALGLVPWIVTMPVVEEGQEQAVLARRAFVVGVVALWFAVLFSLLGLHAK